MGQKLRTVGFGAGSTRTEQERAWCQNRPPDARPPAPRPGDRVLFRSNMWFDPVPAQVVAVYWRDEDGFGNWANLLLPDPWPRVLLRVTTFSPGTGKLADHLGLPREVVRYRQEVTWEARLEGSPGWLPLDYEDWPRPPVQDGPALILPGGDR